MGNEDFECIRVIGKGSYGEVWLAKHKKDKKQYVLKKMNLGKASKRERKSAEQEAKLLSKLKHPNIVSYKDSFETDGFLYIAMQYCEGGDLYARLKEQKGVVLEERQVVEWFVQIAMALQYMHERNILHRDLKTQNIFLTKSKIIKVGDLGIARILDNASAMATTLIGTPYYMSPELFSNKPYNHKSDVWALGCCVYEMTTLKHAFNAKDMNSLVYKILKGKMPPMPCQYSSELLILMRSMLHQDPEKRPSVNRILRDPYIKKNIAIFLEDTKRNSRQTSQPSVRQIPLSVSRPTSASASSKDSSLAEADPVNQAINILNYHQKPKVTENTSIKPNCVKKSSVASCDLEVITEKVKEHVKSFSCGDAEQTPAPSSMKEILSPKKESAPRKKNFLRNHAKSSKPELNEIAAQGRDWHERGKLPCVQDNGREKIVPEIENLVRSCKSESGQNEVEEQQCRGISHNIETTKGNNKSVPELQIESEQIESLQRKKNNLRSNAKSSRAVQNEIEAQGGESREREHKSIESPLGQAENNAKMVQHFKPLKSENRTRPLPVPRVKASAGIPQHSEERHVTADFHRSSSVSSSTEDTETPRSLPNLSARQRRRQQKNEFAGSKENPNPAKIKLRRLPERPESGRITKSERRDLEPPRLRPTRQASINDSTSSSDEFPKVTEKEGTKEKEAERENKEMNNFICLLDNTLQMNNMIETSEEEEELEMVPKKVESVSSKALLLPTQLPQQPTRDQQFHKSVSMPSVETLTDTSRLMHRIRMLHMDCIRGVGYGALKEAYAILNKIDEDEVEPKLVNLLGKEKFDEYAGKIWQLKFCEESLFEIQ